MMLKKANCDWLHYKSVRWPLSGPWPMKAAKESRPSAETRLYRTDTVSDASPQADYATISFLKLGQL